MATNKEAIDLKLPTVIRPRRKVWFLNGELVRIQHTNRSAGIVILDNLTSETRMTVALAEFRKKRKRAYTVTETAQLLNFHRKSIPRLITAGLIPPPMGELPNGERAWQHYSYYSEDAIFDMRDILSMQHHGPPRKDGGITNNKTPTVQELRYAMGDGMMLYVRNDDGRMVPVFSETL